MIQCRKGIHMAMIKLLTCAVIFFILGYLFANADLITSDESNVERIANPGNTTAEPVTKTPATNKTSQQESAIVVEQVLPEALFNKERVQKLEQELARVLSKIEQLKEENSTSNLYGNSNNNESISDQSDLPLTSDEQNKQSMTANLASIEEFLPEPFSSIVLDSPENIKQQFQEIHSESDDYDWALLMEQQIGDFVMLHELSAFLDNFVVKCNAGICELRGFEKQDNAWRKVMMDVEVQPWWQFQNTSSRTTNNEEYGLYFYVMASMSH